MIVKIGNKSSIQTVSMLWKEMVLEMCPGWEPRVDWWCQLAERLFDTGEYNILAVFDGDEIVGFGDFIIWKEPSTGKKHSVGQHIYIKPKFRNTHAAFLLLRAWEKSSKKEKSDFMEMFSFKNASSIWEKVGFSPERYLMRKEVCYV